jgi:hypothetical protein
MIAVAKVDRVGMEEIAVDITTGRTDGAVQH